MLGRLFAILTSASDYQLISAGFLGADLFDDFRFEERVDCIHGTLLGEPKSLPNFPRGHRSVIPQEEQQLLLFRFDGKFPAP